MSTALSRRGFVQIAALGALGSIAALASAGCQDDPKDSPEKGIDTLSAIESTRLETSNFEIELTEAKLRASGLYLHGTIRNITNLAQLPIFTLEFLPKDGSTITDSILANVLPDPTPNYCSNDPQPSDWMLEPDEALEWGYCFDGAYNGAFVFRAHDLAIYHNSNAGFDLLVEDTHPISFYGETTKSYACIQYGYVINRTSEPHESPDFSVVLVHGSDKVRGELFYNYGDYSKRDTIPAGGFCCWKADFSANTDYTGKPCFIEKDRYDFFKKYGSDFECRIKEQGYSSDAKGIENATTNNILPCSMLTYKVSSKQWEDGKYVIDVYIENKTSEDIEPFRITVICKSYHDKEVARQTYNQTETFSHFEGEDYAHIIFKFDEDDVLVTPDKVVIEVEPLG